MTVVYRLENPIYEPLNTDLIISLFKENTYLSSNSIIPANIKVVVDRVLNRAKEFSKIAKLNPTVENISNARIWINLMDESILKDQLQEDINNIIDIADMQLEIKSVTSNVDVYVKSENALSLSLDTNSIIFDNYSGVEDIEKLNAINLTISSSLPYKVNAYLASEIQNADKSNIIDKSILNIKANSDTNYKEFMETINPVILLDDQSKGNGISHGIDLKLASNQSYKADIYKTVIKFEVEQK